MVGTGEAPKGGIWITIGFVTWLLAALVGSGLMHPAARKMRNAAPGSDEAISYARRIALIGGGEIILIVIAIWAMGAQPGS